MLSPAAVAISLAVGVPILIVKGIEVSWSAGALALVVGRLLGATVLWTAIGVGLGLAVKHQVAAIAGTLVWVPRAGRSSDGSGTVLGMRAPTVRS